jgi:hypothetical protein
LGEVKNMKRPSRLELMKRELSRNRNIKEAQEERAAAAVKAGKMGDASSWTRVAYHTEGVIYGLSVAISIMTEGSR